MQFAMLPLQGLGQGAQPIISYNLRLPVQSDRVKGAFRLLLKASMVYSTLLWAFVMLFPQGFCGYVYHSGALIDFTKTALRIYMPACLLLFGIQVSCQMTIYGAGERQSFDPGGSHAKIYRLLIPLIYIMPLIFPADKTTAVYIGGTGGGFLSRYLLRRSFSRFSSENLSGSFQGE